MVYDSGAYHDVMEKALALADWNGFPARKAAARKRGRYRGIGVANYVDTATGIPRERAELTVHPDGGVDVVIGTVSNGQGHETSFAQLLNEWLGVPIDKVRLDHRRHRHRQGRRRHPFRPRHAARQHRDLEGLARRSSRRARRVAALLLQDKPEAVEFQRRSLHRQDGGGSMTLGGGRGRDEPSAPICRTSCAGRWPANATRPSNDRGLPLRLPCLRGRDRARRPEPGEIVQHTGVDDVGRAVNPLIIHGQTHGGIAQGVGQALLEQCFYDAGSGQLLSGSFMDYAMPRADMLPFYTTEISEVPSTTHPLGIRPAGEGGTTPALGVVVNAIVDALAEFGVDHIEMPATPERIWRAIRGKPQRSRRSSDEIEQEQFGAR